jgi:hypothetical protein
MVIMKKIVLDLHTMDMMSLYAPVFVRSVLQVIVARESIVQNPDTMMPIAHDTRITVMTDVIISNSMISHSPKIAPITDPRLPWSFVVYEDPSRTHR